MRLQPRFNSLYAKIGRPTIAAENLLRALLPQALYSVRSERILMEKLDYNLLFRWFVGLNMDDPSGIFKVGWVFTFAAAAYNLVRMGNLAMQAA